jgi:hypothetical protein
MYILASDIRKSKLIEIFRRLVSDEIKKHVRIFDVTKPEYFFIIGGCNPKDNILLYHKSKTFPEKLKRLVDSDKNLKYILRESDVSIDIEAFNAVFDSIFNELFVSKTKFTKLVGKYDNIFMIRHSRLDCYSMFKVLKYVLGASNCINVYAETFKDKRQYLLSVNDLITGHSNKTEMNKSPTFKKIVTEIRKYVNECIGLVDESK